MKCTLTVTDEVWCQFNGLIPVHIEYLWKELGIFKDGYFWMPAYKIGRWDGKIHFFEKTGVTYVKLLDKILPFLEKWGYEIDIIDNRTQLLPVNTGIEIIKVDNSNTAIEATGLDIFGDATRNGRQINLYPYQAQCVKMAIEAGSGILVLATSSGKSLITCAISKCYESAGHRAITIVPSDDLIKQTAAWYRDCKLDTGVYSGSEKDIYHTHVVATWQSLKNNPRILQDFNVLIFDETHGAKAEVSQQLLNRHAQHIAHRFGVTGTFPKPKCDQYALISSLGPVLMEVPASWLIANGYVATVEIQPIELNETYIDEEFPDYGSERAFLARSPTRLEKIADLIISECAIHGNTLVLVSNIPFGKKLAALIKDSIFLYGESSGELRKEHYDSFETRDDIILIASAGIASTGISIDRIFHLCLVDAGKSFIRSIQSIGRGLRKGKDKNHIHVSDVHSKLKWSRKHFRDRLKYYTEAKYPVLKKATVKVIK